MEGDEDVDEGIKHFGSARSAGFGQVLYVEPSDVYLRTEIPLAPAHSEELISPRTHNHIENNTGRQTGEGTARPRHRSNL